MRAMSARAAATAVAATMVLATAAVIPAGAAASGLPIASGHAAGPAMGLATARDASANANASARRGRDPNMTYHNGKIMTTAVVKSIFWGTSWGTYGGDKMTGLDGFYAGHSNSNYSRTVDEYTGLNLHVGGATTSNGHVVDASTASSGGSTSVILAEVVKEINAGAVTLDTAGNGYYPVYTDVPRGNAGYCAWHSYGTVTSAGVSTVVQFAFFFKLDGDPGCDPQDTSGLHSQGLAALANVSAHELSEARSDPASPSAWYDASGAENGDKCAWTFNVPLVTFSNSSRWKVQGEWSNAAYTAGTGYPNRSGQNGCLDGH
ncbi:MAG: hypothetical protein JWO37_3409 [Acidimicrobiales bacterium]|jgi:hypothetical protein|nr:hypothetical protein [Acidimicrobiales bacterium]